MAHNQDVLNSLVPITQFNRGQASRIFDRLHQEDMLIVLKNNQPTAVIMSPVEYSRLNEIEENYYLLLEAMRRLSDKDSQVTPIDDLLKEFDISDKDLEACEEPVIG